MSVSSACDSIRCCRWIDHSLLAAADGARLARLWFGFGFAADIAEALLEIGLSAESTKAALTTGGVKAREVSKAFGTEAVINAQVQQVGSVINRTS